MAIVRQALSETRSAPAASYTVVGTESDAEGTEPGDVGVELGAKSLELRAQSRELRVWGMGDWA